MSLRKKPWNRVNLPVYSISSTNGREHNMHIITYVTAISMEPKRFVVGVYHGTKTLELVQQQQEFVLQLLAGDQYNLVNLLGKQSGTTIDKIARLQKRKLLQEWNGFYILKEALAVLQLRVITSFEGGDHKGFLCEVTDWKNLNEGEALTLNNLRERNIIRA